MSPAWCPALDFTWPRVPVLRTSCTSLSLAGAMGSRIRWGWHNPKGCWAVWAHFRNFSSSSVCIWCLWLLLDAAQGTDVLICGMGSRSSLIAAVERKREILFSGLFNQFIQILWPTGCYLGCPGTCMRDVYHAKFCEWDSMGAGVSRTAWHPEAQN